MTVDHARDSRGRFTGGTAPGPGRPPGPERYRTLTGSVISPAAWRDVLARLLEQAQSGDVEAAKFLARELRAARLLPHHPREWNPLEHLL